LGKKLVGTTAAPVVIVVALSTPAIVLAQAEGEAEAYVRHGVDRLGGGVFGAYLDKSHLDEAIADFTRALELDPRSAKAYIGRGVARSRKGDLDGAIADYTQGLLLNPRDAEAYAKRGSVRWQKGDLDVAITDFDQALALDPTLSMVYWSRGRARLQKENFPGALEDFQRAVQINPQLKDFVTPYIQQAQEGLKGTQ